MDVMTEEFEHAVIEDVLRLGKKKEEYRTVL